jgi:hypothetical protein
MPALGECERRLTPSDFLDLLELQRRSLEEFITWLMTPLRCC